MPIVAAGLLAACTTPLRPDPNVALEGDWRVIAVAGESVPAQWRDRFRFSYQPPTGSAQFGCNIGSGSAQVRSGWLATGDWIITAAGCPGERGSSERTGFEILAWPLAIEPLAGGRVRLRNERGSVTIEREPVSQLAGTRWRVVSVNGHGADPGATVHFTPSSYEARFGCNRVFGSFRQISDQLDLGWSMTEMGCTGTTQSGVPIHDFEDWGSEVLRADPAVKSAGAGRVVLENEKGSILLERLP